MGGDYRQNKQDQESLYQYRTSGAMKLQNNKQGEHPHKSSTMNLPLNTPTNSTVKSCQGAGNFSNDYGNFNSYEYTMENGAILKANHKDTSNPFAIGDPVSYEVKRIHPQHGASGKVGAPIDMTQGSQAPSNSGGASQGSNPQPTTPSPANRAVDINDSILYQVALKGSMDYYTTTFDPQFDSGFNGKNINDLALEIAMETKINIQKLKS